MANTPDPRARRFREYVERLTVALGHADRREPMRAYLTGLCLPGERKSIEPMAARVDPRHVRARHQSMHHFVANAPWDGAALLRVARDWVLAPMARHGPVAAWIVDDTAYPKKGRHSVGVARQYSGTLGKVANCQIAVNCHYAERTVAWPVATRLYLSKAWCADAARRQATQVPEALTFQTKAAIGLDLIDQANTWGVRHACVVADAAYGDDPVFLNGLEGRRERYVVAVRANFSVVQSRQATPEVERVDALLATLPRWQWQTIRWREGSQGWLRAKFVGMRCWRVDGDGTRHVGWLIGQRPTRGDGDWKYFWSNFPLNTPLAIMVEYTHRRYWVEQFHEEAKSLLGWDQYQGRLWHGFHRHAALIMLTYSFLVWLELRERERISRRGRPRRAFSPSA